MKFRADEISSVIQREIEQFSARGHAERGRPACSRSATASRGSTASRA